MQNVLDIVDIYLAMDTCYAIMVTGAWGTGKTHYFKETVLPKIKDTPVFNNGKKKYHPVLISLFGQKSIDDIQADILVSLYPVFGNKYAKMGSSVVKGLLKGYLKLKGMDQYNEALDHVKVEKNDWINFEEIVLIFDDLERLGKELPLAELIGYINSLVESQNIKVIIITNEDKLDRDNYHALKEKTVGNTVQYIPRLADSIQSIIGSKFEGFPAFKKHLEENIQMILDLFLPHSNNLRIFFFCMSYYQFVFSEIDNALIKVKILADKKDEILHTILKFAIAISIEYKEGRVEFSNRNELDRKDHLPLHQLFAEKAFAGNGKKEEGEKEYYKQFEEQYYDGQEYFFFSSVFDLLTGGGKLNTTQLESEIMRLYHIEQNTIPLHYTLFDRLKHPNVYLLTDKDYLSATKRLLSYADQGVFDLPNYPTVFYFVSRFGNPLHIPLDRLQARIIAGMKKGVSHYNHVTNLDMHFAVSPNDPNLENLKEIVAAALTINKNLETIALKKDSDTLQHLFLSDLDKFTEAMLDRNAQFHYTAVFHRFNSNRVYAYLLHLDNPSIVKVIRILNNRIRQGLGMYFKEEKPFFEALGLKVQKKALQLKGKNISGFIWDDLNNEINSYIAAL